MGNFLPKSYIWSKRDFCCLSTIVCVVCLCVCLEKQGEIAFEVRLLFFFSVSPRKMIASSGNLKKKLLRDFMFVFAGFFSLVNAECKLIFNSFPTFSRLSACWFPFKLAINKLLVGGKWVVCIYIFVRVRIPNQLAKLIQFSSHN